VQKSNYFSCWAVFTKHRTRQNQNTTDVF
jgi:hypothetical protein